MISIAHPSQNKNMARIKYCLILIKRCCWRISSIATDLVADWCPLTPCPTALEYIPIVTPVRRGRWHCHTWGGLTGKQFTPITSPKTSTFLHCQWCYSSAGRKLVSSWGIADQTLQHRDCLPVWEVWRRMGLKRARSHAQTKGAHMIGKSHSQGSHCGGAQSTTGFWLRCFSELTIYSLLP